MAGKERRRVKKPMRICFEDRPYVLCPRGGGDLDQPGSIEFTGWISPYWRACRLFWMPASTIDVVAFTSHVPQLLSTALASVLAGR